MAKARGFTGAVDNATMMSKNSIDERLRTIDKNYRKNIRGKREVIFSLYLKKHRTILSTM